MRPSSILALALLVTALAVTTWWIATSDSEAEELDPPTTGEDVLEDAAPRRESGRDTSGMGPSPSARVPTAAVDGERSPSMPRAVARGMVETEDGAGVETVVEVSVRSGGDKQAILASTDESGRFDCHLTPFLESGAELSSVSFGIDDVALEAAEVRVDAAEAVEENGALVFEARLVVRRRTLVTGRVVDGTGVPLPDAALMLVTARDGRPEIEDAVAFAMAGDDGRFTLRIGAVRPYIVVAMPEAHRPGTASVLPRPGRSTDVGDVSCKESVTISGVLTFQGRPVADATVAAVALEGGRGVAHHSTQARVYKWSNGVMDRWKTNARTDADGRFLFTGLAPERYRIHAGDYTGPFKLDPDAQNSEWWFYSTENEVTLAGAVKARITSDVVTTTAVEVEAPALGVEMQIRAAVARVLVLDGEAPVAGARVEIEEDDTEGETGPSGELYLIVPTGSRTFTANKEGFSAVSTTVVMSENLAVQQVPIELAAEVLARVVVCVVAPGGGPVAEADVRMTPTSRDENLESLHRKMKSDDGRCDVGPVHGGDWAVLVRAAGEQPLTHEQTIVSVPATGTREVVIRMILGARLRVGARRGGAFVGLPFRLRPVDGEGIRVTVSAATANGGRRTSTGSSPTLGDALNDVEPILEPGRYELFFGDGDERVRRVVNLTAGETREVIVDL